MILLTGLRDFVARMMAAVFVYPAAVVSLRTGRWERARNQLSWVIFHSPRHFSAHIQLGRLYLHMGNRSEALRLLNQARWIDPYRFEKTDLPREIHATLGRDPLFRPRNLVIEPGRAGRGLESDRSHGPAGAEGHASGRRKSAFGQEVRTSSFSYAEADDAEFQYRDFSDMDEYLRFRSLPPITSGEIATVDWDQLFEQLDDTV